MPELYERPANNGGFFLFFVLIFLREIFDQNVKVVKTRGQ
ncbi:hypothetical protein HMPREF0880_03151 [Yokenella regensburgei ATCC 43003]|nr:hypothetical protein HMPREF0880_03151 [Yokenella regensburgei ATCC 43003]